jgi:hypothetical protein
MSLLTLSPEPCSAHHYVRHGSLDVPPSLLRRPTPPPTPQASLLPPAGLKAGSSYLTIFAGTITLANLEFRGGTPLTAESESSGVVIRDCKFVDNAQVSGFEHDPLSRGCHRHHQAREEILWVVPIGVDADK